MAEECQIIKFKASLNIQVVHKNKSYKREKKKNENDNDNA